MAHSFRPVAEGSSGSFRKCQTTVHLTFTLVRQISSLLHSEVEFQLVAGFFPLKKMGIQQVFFAHIFSVKIFPPQTQQQEAGPILRDRLSKFMASHFLAVAIPDRINPTNPFLRKKLESLTRNS